MELLKELTARWDGIDHPFMIHENGSLSFSDLQTDDKLVEDNVKQGDVVALIGDFDPQTITHLLNLIDKKVILVPLTTDTREQHEYFFEAALVDIVIEGDAITRITHDRSSPLIQEVRKRGNAGLVLFSTGTTGRPKAILHDFSLFLKRFATPRPTLRTMNFLLFDHIGGINTLLHTLFNCGTVIVPKSRSVEDVVAGCATFDVEALPTTPTFLRMMLMSGLIPDAIPKSVKVITYGTERMDQPTLDELCQLLPDVDFRQTFGMSELGIVRVKSEARDSLFMKIGGDGIETRTVDNVLHIKSATRMLGYLNAPSPFDEEGWYNTKDIVERKDDFFKVSGRDSEVINVGGLKFMASEVERVAIQFPGVELVKVDAKPNPITGQHAELTVQAKGDAQIDGDSLKAFLDEKLPSHMMPRRIRFKEIAVGHRFKRA